MTARSSSSSRSGRWWTRRGRRRRPRPRRPAASRRQVDAALGQDLLERPGREPVAADRADHHAAGVEDDAGHGPAQSAASRIARRVGGRVVLVGDRGDGLVEVCRGQLVGGQVLGEAEGGDQGRDGVGGRAGPGRVGAEGAGEEGLPLGRPGGEVAHDVREEQAGGHAVGDAVARAEPLAERVAEAGPGRSGQRVGEPGAELALGARGRVGRVAPRGQQRGLEAAQPLERERVREGVAAGREQALDGVVDRADPARQPEVERGLEREGGVVEDRGRHGAPARAGRASRRWPRR